jgi:hypothetical protein
VDPQGRQAATAEPLQRGGAVVHVLHGYFELVDQAGPPDVLADAGVANGLVALGSTGAIV